MNSTPTKSLLSVQEWKNNNLQTEQPSTPNTSTRRQPYAELDESDGTQKAQISWENPPTVQNRTYLKLDDEAQRNRKMPSRSLAHKDHYDLVYPNYKRLELLNRGLWNWEWERKERLHPTDDWRLAHALMCQLEMTNYQKCRFHSLFWKLDRQQLGLPTGKVAFGICMLVCWEDGRKASPRQKPWDSEFERVAAQQGYRKPLSVFEKVKRELKERVKDKKRRRTHPNPPIRPFTLSSGRMVGPIAA